MIRPYNRAFAMITASMYFMILAGCGGGDSSPTSPTPPTPPPPPAPVATSIAVTPASHTLTLIGATVQLSALVRDQNGNRMTGQTITWTSTNTTVAPVNTQGLVRAISNGTVQITARSGNASGTANITVAEPVPTRITITPSSHTLEAIGATVQLSATVRDQRNNIMSGQTITWSSGDEAVATVSEAGLVTAVGNGMVEITAKSGNPSSSATITVSEPVATSVTIDPASHTFEAIGDTVQLAAVVLDQHENVMADAAVIWSSGDETVATVDGDGLVTAVNNGMAEITAQAGDAMGSAAITVAQAPAGISIEVEAEATTLTEIGQTLQLMVSVSDANDNPIAEPAVSWTSSDEAVVTVDGGGLVTAVGNGMADIVATAGDASDMVGITVMVPAEPVATTVTVEPATHTIEAIGETVQLAAVVLDQHENVMADAAVIWSSGDETVATVDGDGLVTAVNNGMAEITAQAGDAMGSAAITVAQAPAGISIEVEAEATTLTEIGQTLQLMVSVSDANDNPIAEPAVSWTSSDEAVVTVDGGGLVTAVGNGMADIVATAGDASDMVGITVMVPAEPVATTVTVEPATHTIEAIGETVQLAAVVLDQHENVMADAAVIWSSGDETVATVDGDGLVTAVNNGMAEITAQAGDAMGSAAITVAQAPAGISIEVEAEATTLTEIGQTLQLMVSVSDANDNPIAEPAVSWTSSDEAVVTVDGGGLVTAVGNGMADIVATAGDASDMVGITVMLMGPDGEPTAITITVTIEPASHTLEAIGATVQLAAMVLDQDGNEMADVTVTWSSSDEAVATVDGDGLVTAVGNGMAEITAQAGEAMGTAAITVAQVPAGISIEVDAEATTLTEIGQTLQLMVTVSDANDAPVSEPAVKWTSSDEAVVTVDGDGLVTAVGNGTADVVASSGDVSAMVGITVSVTVDEGDTTEYIPWVGVKVFLDKLEFKSDNFTLPVTGCFTAALKPLELIVGPLPPEGIKDWTNSFTNDTLTVHYSEWQRSEDMGGTWHNIEGTRVMYDACAYDPEVAGVYRLVGDITLNGEREFRRSENTFTVP